MSITHKCKHQSINHVNVRVECEIWRTNKKKKSSLTLFSNAEHIICVSVCICVYATADVQANILLVAYKKQKAKIKNSNWEHQWWYVLCAKLCKVCVCLRCLCRLQTVQNASLVSIQQHLENISSFFWFLS